LLRQLGQHYAVTHDKVILTRSGWVLKEYQSIFMRLLSRALQDLSAESLLTLTALLDGVDAVSRQ
jgi:hypothetical protein